MARELAVLGLATVAYLLWGPRSAWVYLGLATLFALYVFIDARLYGHVYWETKATPVSTRYRTATVQLAIPTVLIVAVFIWISPLDGRGIDYSNLAAAVLLYGIWATVQQFIFQIYLHGRLRVLLSAGSPFIPAAVTGLCYAVVHAPEWPIVALTAAAGPVWSLVYLQQRVLLPIAASHAILGTTYYYFVAGRDLLEEIYGFLGV